jgi:hypothetical protein
VLLKHVESLVVKYCEGVVVNLNEEMNNGGSSTL